MEVSGSDYCSACGSRLIEKYNEREGRDVHFCPVCGQWRFPLYNVACSMIVMNEEKNRILLIKQYGVDEFVLVAGYVNAGEDAENTVRREIHEELGLSVSSISFNRSHYFAPSNTLMLNWTVTVEDSSPAPNEEIDSYQWFTLDEARRSIKKGGLAQTFLNCFLDGRIYDFDREITLV